MKNSKLNIGFAGARWLGIECLKLLVKKGGVKISAVCFPKRKGYVWWKDVIDEEEVNNLGFKITPWERWTDLRFDLIFSVLHGGIFRQEHINSSKLGVINLHPAPLPEYRGCNSYAHAIMNGEKKYRVTMHYIDTGIDTGPIIAEKTIPLDINDTGFSLYRKAQIASFSVFKNMLPRIIASAKKDRLVPSIAQNEKGAHYYRRDSLKNKEVDLKWKPENLYNFVRALDFPPFEPSFAIINRKKVFLVTTPRLRNDL